MISRAANRLDVPAAEPQEQRYRDALRHSSRVRFLRKAIPIGAVATVVGVAAISVLEPFRNLPKGLSLGAVDLSGTRVTMELPKLTGFKRDLRPYEVTAKTASQDIRNPTVIDLTDLRARIALEDKGVATVEAAEGVYDTRKETMQLRRQIKVRSDSGYDVLLKSASVDFKSGYVVSKDPVHVLLKGGSIDADAVEIMDNGKRVVFTGRVRTLIQPDALMQPIQSAEGGSP
jgi:lipopolysaccharide export system protein LptC